jgi:hypothetical protein
MAKKKSEEVVQPTISAVTQSETADTNLGDKTPQEIRNERADAIKQQRNIIRDERKSDNTNQANIDLAKQNIETLRSNAKLNIEQAKANRRDQYADEAISSVAKWMEDTGGEPLTEESLASILTPKQLWHFQKKYNQGSNWGNALGGRAFFGNLNDRTVQLLTEQANKKIAANKKAANERKTYVPYGDVEGGFEINNSRLNDIKDWGNGVTDDNITPEQAQALYAKLESYGMQVPKKTVPVLDAEGKETKDANGNVITQEVYDTDGTSTIGGLYDKLGTVNGVDDNEDVLNELGFRDGAGNIARPHRKTYEEILAEQQKKQQELDYINQQKALARKQARLGLADIAAGIGDIIKASGGALVDKRDYQDMYNRLTAQQQKNFDNYLARMQALKEQEKAKQKEAAEQARQERLLKEQRLYNEQLQQKQWAHDEDVLEQKHKNKMAEIKARGQEKLKEIDERYKNQIDKFNNAGAIVFDGTDYTFDKARNNNVISQLLPIVSNYFTEENGYISAIAGIEDSVMSEYGKAGERANIVLSALKDFEYQFSREDRDNIVKILTEYSNSRKAVESPVGGVTTVKPANAEKKYRAANGEIITQSQFDGLSQPQKDKCEPINE